MGSPQFFDEDTHSPTHGPAIADATATYDPAVINAVLAALRSAGIIALD